MKAALTIEDLQLVLAERDAQFRKELDARDERLIELLESSDTRRLRGLEIAQKRIAEVAGRAEAAQLAALPKKSWITIRVSDDPLKPDRVESHTPASTERNPQVRFTLQRTQPAFRIRRETWDRYCVEDPELGRHAEAGNLLLEPMTETQSQQEELRLANIRATQLTMSTGSGGPISLGGAR